MLDSSLESEHEINQFEIVNTKDLLAEEKSSLGKENDFPSFQDRIETGVIINEKGFPNDSENLPKVCYLNRKSTKT